MACSDKYGADQLQIGNCFQGKSTGAPTKVLSMMSNHPGGGRDKLNCAMQSGVENCIRGVQNSAVQFSAIQYNAVQCSALRHSVVM